MTQLYAQPYNIDANGFYFEDAEEFKKKSHNLCDSFGQPAEEFEIQWIEGEVIDQQLFKALNISQSNIELFLEKIEEWTDEDKEKVLIKCELYPTLNVKDVDPDDIDIIYYKVSSMKDLAEQFVDEGYYGDLSTMPDALKNYIDYDSIANDLRCSGEYGEIDINNEHIIYSCC